jgi:tRNA-dihydrouridine synthase B
MVSSGFVRQLRESRVMTAPIAGYTDVPFRRVLADFDAPFTVTEMISADALARGLPHAIRMMERVDGDGLQGVQIVGGDPATMAGAARAVEGGEMDYVDINMGCLDGEVVRSGGGFSLMSNEVRAVAVASAVVEAVSIPVTCKMRLGPTKGRLTAVPLSKKLADVGVSAISIHGRTGERRLGSPVDHEGIRRVVDALSIPVVANGGIFTGADAVEMVKLTGAAAVMPARGLIGNPWLLREIHCALSHENWCSPSLQERKRVCRLHLSYLCDRYGEVSGVVSMRRVLPRYFSGGYNVGELRRDVEAVTTIDEAEGLMGRIRETDSGLAYEVA